MAFERRWKKKQFGKGKVGLVESPHMKSSLLARKQRHFLRMTGVVVGRTVWKSDLKLRLGGQKI